MNSIDDLSIHQEDRDRGPEGPRSRSGDPRPDYPVGYNSASRLGAVAYQRLPVMQGSGFSLRIQRPAGLRADGVYPTPSEAVNSSRTNPRLQRAVRGIGVVGRRPSIARTRESSPRHAAFFQTPAAWARADRPASLVLSAAAAAAPRPGAPPLTDLEITACPRAARPPRPGASGALTDRPAARAAGSRASSAARSGAGSRGTSRGREGGGRADGAWSVEPRTPREVLLSMSPPPARSIGHAFFDAASPELL
jgi:hypothetical protein